jgi:hypothetical protein
VAGGVFRRLFSGHTVLGWTMIENDFEWIHLYIGAN